MNQMNQRPTETEYGGAFAGYVAKVPEREILPVLEEQIAELYRVAAAVPADREGFRYAPGKWSIRQVIGHIADCERVFQYRAFAFSRGEQAALPGFDENAYMTHADFDGRSLAELVDELVTVRESSLALLRHLDEEGWTRMGIANDVPISVRAMAYVMAGHLRHHLALLRERYGVA